MQAQLRNKHGAHVARQLVQRPALPVVMRARRARVLLMRATPGPGPADAAEPGQPEPAAADDSEPQPPAWSGASEQLPAPWGYQDSSSRSRAASRPGSPHSGSQQPAQPGSPPPADPLIAAGIAAAGLAIAFALGRTMSPAVRALPPPPLASVRALDHAQAAGVKQPAAASRGKSWPIGETLHYSVRQLFAMPAVGKVLAVICVAAPIVLLGGLAYRAAVQQVQQECTWQEALVRTYSVLNNAPGSSVESERGPAADLVLHLVYLAGLFTFAVVLGIVTDDISTTVEKVRCGNWPIVERRHTCILNWNSQTLPVLQQMALARQESGGRLFAGPIVVLADRDKADMDEEIADELGELARRLPVVTRSGNPARPAEQRRGAVAAADTVVLLWPELPAADASASQAAVLSALKASGGIAGQKVVVQSAGEVVQDFDAAHIAAALAASSCPGAQVASLTTSGNERVAQIMAQVANQPGLEDVFADLLEYEARDDDSQLGAEFYCCVCPPHLEGKSYQHVRRSFAAATVVGWISGLDGRLHLNSSDSSPVPPGSQLVLVASGVSAEVPLATPYQVNSMRLGGRKGDHIPPRDITVLCFEPEAAQGIVRSLLEFCSRGSHVTLVCEGVSEDALRGLKARGIRLSLLAGSPSSRAVLASKGARLEQADSVVLAGLDGKEPTAADAQVLASVLQLQALAAGHARRRAPLAVVATLSGSAAEDVLWHTALSFHAELKAAAANRAAAAAARGAKGAPDPAAAADAVAAPVSLHLLRPSELMSGMLTQTACAPQLALAFSELFSLSSGHEVYLRDPRLSFGLPLSKPLRWKDLAEVVRKRGETAIGYTQASSVQPLGQQAEVHLAPGAEAELMLAPGDKLVVMALE